MRQSRFLRLEILLPDSDEVVSGDSPHCGQVFVRSFDAASVQNRIPDDLRESRFRAHGAQIVRRLLGDRPLDLLFRGAVFREFGKDAERFVREFLPVFLQTRRTETGESRNIQRIQIGADVESKLFLIFEELSSGVNCCCLRKYR